MSDKKRQIQISLPSTGEDEWLATKEPIMSGWLTHGPKVGEFEKAFAKRHDVKHALAVTSCTTGLHLALAALGVSEGDEVIVPAFTWVATANVVLYCGATPIFVDIDIADFNMDMNQVKNAITEKTKAIIPVHLFGVCADMTALKSIAGNIPIVEDAACASGASFNNSAAGSLGNIGVFSFHPRKSITTGEGGMVTTNDDDLAEKMNMLRNHGASISEEQRHNGPRPYLLPEFNLLGFNYRMTDLQGSVGLVQLAKLDGFINERQQWATYYENELAEIDWLRTPKVPSGTKAAWQAYVCYVDAKKAPMPRNEIMEILQQKGISTRPGTHAVHMLGLYRDQFDIKPEDFPCAQKADAQSMAIPLHNRMNVEDYEYVVKILRGI